VLGDPEFDIRQLQERLLVSQTFRGLLCSQGNGLSGRFPLGYSGLDVKLIIHFNVVLRLRTSGVIMQFPYSWRVQEQLYYY
jgi:hypothetical protein